MKIIPLLNALQGHGDHATRSTTADRGIAVERSSINQLWCRDGDDEACQKRSKTKTELHIDRESEDCREYVAKEDDEGMKMWRRRSDRLADLKELKALP